MDSTTIQYIAIAWVAVAIIIFPFLLKITAPEGVHAALDAATADLRDAGSIADVAIATGEAISCVVTLADIPD